MTTSSDAQLLLDHLDREDITGAEAVTRGFQQHNIETVAELAAALAGPERDVLRAELGALWGVGPKTLNYLSILAGDARVVAIDVQIRTVARAAGITDVTTGHLESVLHETAAIRGWRAGDLDAAIWNSTQH